MGVGSVVRGPFRQARGFFGNLADIATGTRASDILPPWIIETIAWFKAQIPLAAGYGSPAEQITGSVTLAIAMVISSLGLLTPLALVMLIPITIGFWRLVPAVNDRWPLGS